MPIQYRVLTPHYHSWMCTTAEAGQARKLPESAWARIYHATNKAVAKDPCIVMLAFRNAKTKTSAMSCHGTLIHAVGSSRFRYSLAS